MKNAINKTNYILKEKAAEKKNLALESSDAQVIVPTIPTQRKKKKEQPFQCAYAKHYSMSVPYCFIQWYLLFIRLVLVLINASFSQFLFSLYGYIESKHL